MKTRNATLCPRSCSSCSSAPNRLRDLAQPDLFGAATIADFFLEKDPLFARLTLNDEEFAFIATSTITCNCKPPRPIW